MCWLFERSPSTKWQWMIGRIKAPLHYPARWKPAAGTGFPWGFWLKLGANSAKESARRIIDILVPIDEENHQSFRKLFSLLLANVWDCCSQLVTWKYANKTPVNLTLILNNHFSVGNWIQRNVRWHCSKAICLLETIGLFGVHSSTACYAASIE